MFTYTIESVFAIDEPVNVRLFKKGKTFYEKGIITEMNIRFDTTRIAEIEYTVTLTRRKVTVGFNKLKKLIEDE